MRVRVRVALSAMRGRQVSERVAVRVVGAAPGESGAAVGLVLSMR